MISNASRLPASIAFLAVFVLAVTPGCSKKKKNRTRGAVPAQVEPEPEPEEPEDIIDTDVGEEVPPVEGDVVVIESGDQPAKKHLVFTASGTTEEGRYTSEFLLVVRATSESCVRLKVRPSAGLESEVSDENIGGVTDVGECEAYPEDAPKPKEPAKEEDPPKDEANPTDPAALTGLDFSGRSGLGLAGSGASLCSYRLFRMPGGEPRQLGQPAGLGPVVTKTARLGAISTKKLARVWVDSEVGNICASGSPGNLPITSFGPLAQLLPAAYPTGYADDKDQLRVEHLQNIASEMERVITTLTATFGDLSDIDKNQGIDIIITPDVNRKFFIPFDTFHRDHFRVDLIYKPEDLANYNSTSNPTSNEGEVVYLWAPDPAGLYNYGSYPSSNSLTSNYAKGYAATQVMNLINFNSHLLVTKGKAEKRWMVESLSLLASAYVAGNSYSGISLGSYLASRPQTFSLTEDIDSKIPDDYKPYTREGQLGMRAMFGWYLHTILCDGKSVAPCAKIRDLIATELVGEPNVEAVVGAPLPKILENFGATVGVAMADNPKAVRQLFTAGTEGLPAVATMPVLTEIIKSAPPKTFEISHDAATTGGGFDRAVAGPFPSYDSLLYQPIFPDNDKDIKLAKNSVTYILLTGLVDAETDVTAHLGPNLNIAVIPLGDRNGDLRRVHEEKVSEAAHMDLRPVNLTDVQDDSRTYYNAPEHSVNFDVTAAREIWAVGSVDNFSVNQEGESTEVGDADSLNLRIDPCKGAANEAACRASGDKYVILQVIPQDFHKQLEPMSLITPTSLGLFRGRSLWAKLDEIDSAIDLGLNVVGVLCQSEYVIGKDSTKTKNCANAGVSAADFQTKVCDVYSADGACPGGKYNQAATFDNYVYLQYTNSFGPFYDNFFHAGPYGFPYYTHDTITFEAAPDLIGYRPFYAEEVHRQFFEFDFQKSLAVKTYKFFPAWSGIGATVSTDIDFDSELTPMESIEISDLLFMRSFVSTNTLPTADSDDEKRYLATCTGLDILESTCKTLPLSGAGSVLDTQIHDTLYAKNKAVLCRPGQSLPSANCSGRTLAAADGQSAKWIEPERLIEYQSDDPNQTLSTYYDPVAPMSHGTHCGGEDIQGQLSNRCEINPEHFIRTGDIRAQLNVPAELARYGGCLTKKYMTDFHVCADSEVHRYKFRGENKRGLEFTYLPQALATARARERAILAGSEAGELGGFPNRYHLFYVKIPAATPSIVHLMVGGLAKSQGKYVIRARAKDYTEVLTPN